MTVGYYGSKGTHLIGITELNDIAPGVALNSQSAVGTAFMDRHPLRPWSLASRRATYFETRRPHRKIQTEPIPTC